MEMEGRKVVELLPRADVVRTPNRMPKRSAHAEKERNEMNAKLLNYTTEIDWRKSVGEITAFLSQSGICCGILQEFDGAGYVTAISFKSKTEFGVLAFRLPCDIQKTQQVLSNEHRNGRIGRRFANDAGHARNVSWRILRSWIEAQIALVRIGQVKVEQVFLPYAQDDEGRTLFEAMRENQFNGLAIENKAAAIT